MKFKEEIVETEKIHKSKFEDQIKEHQERTEKAMQMGGKRKLDALREKGILNARERINYLFDPGTFTESGLYATSFRREKRESSPADGKIAGFGNIEGRKASVIANDFTVMGASSSKTNSRKVSHIKEVSKTRGIPIVFLGESTGARMPDVMGAESMGGASSPTQYKRMREAPWASAVLGNCFGSSAWYASMSDFNVMKKGAIMAVSSPRLASLATREEVDPETLGGWKMHSEITGMADVVVDTDEEAIEAVKRFLSYLPSNHNELPPVAKVPEGSEEASEKILDLIPESKKSIYDVRKVIKSVVDADSYFELKPKFGKTMVTALSRLNGQSVGIIANNPLMKGGAIDADACDKVVSFLVLCDSYNIPLVFLVDQPGFLIGIEAEKKRMPGKVMNWMNAISLCTVPKISIILRKSYGQAFLNMGGGGNAHEVAAWWTGDISFMDPASAVGVVYGINEKEEPEKFQEKLNEMKKDTSAYDMAAVYGAQAVIDPRETRNYLIEMLEIHKLRLSNGIGEHLMRTWPTNY
ncbi:acyl-CoA carboxylase subunit beta [Planococcus salinus]|uniref:acyl-CoA carboxylase subunit beta n=1 Tax=Planococcus salinus TaxID=1848460 RepID=UPI0019604EE3|nr:carboxyl transferase domain-containing protein [Planococcus salinus]